MICHACVYIIDPLVYLSTIEIAYFIHLSFLILFFIEFRQLCKQAPLQMLIIIFLIVFSCRQQRTGITTKVPMLSLSPQILTILYFVDFRL